MSNAIQKVSAVRGLFAAALIAGTIALPTVATAEPGEFVNGVLQPLADGFPNRPITIVSPDEPGSRDGIWARHMQSALKGISPVDIIVSDEPGPSFGTWFTIGDVAGREGGLDGYYPISLTVPGMVSDLTVEPITKELGMTIDDMNIVIVTERIPYVGVQRKDAPWGRKFEDMIKYIKENPKKLIFLSNQVGSGNDIAMEWVFQQIGGLEVTKIPAANSQAQAAAMGAGEGDFGLVQAFLALQLHQAGKADVTFVTGDTVPEPWTNDPNVVSASGYGLPEAPWGIVQGVLVPKEVSKEHVDWLYKLFKAGAESEVYAERKKTVPGMSVNVINPEDANKLKMTILGYVDEVVRNLGMHIDQQK